MKGEIPLSVRAYAKLLKVDEKAIRKAIETGKIKKGFNKQIKKIIPSIADKEYGNAAKVVKPKAGISKNVVAKKLDKNTSTTLPKDKLPEDLPDIDEADIDGLPYSEALRRREITALKLDTLKLQEQEKVLIKKDIIDKVLYDHGSNFKKALLNIPSRVISDVRAAPNETEAIAILDLELNNVLNTYTDIETIKNFATN
jgi:hypothetical protein